jgi:hypothetical protein
MDVVLAISKPKTITLPLALFLSHEANTTQHRNLSLVPLMEVPHLYPLIIFEFSIFHQELVQKIPLPLLSSSTRTLPLTLFLMSSISETCTVVELKGCMC